MHNYPLIFLYHGFFIYLVSHKQFLNSKIPPYFYTGVFICVWDHQITPEVTQRAD